jgi:flavorubredoxin
MQVAVAYESMFGNTKEIAEAIAEGLRTSGPGTEVVVVPVADVTADKVREADLLVVGGPTHVTRMSSARTRKAVAPGPGLREWIDALPAGSRGGRAAAFDTRFGYPLSGSAARPISRQLRRHGYEIVAKPTGFLVERAKGPLKAGERERAKAWGAGLASKVAR